MTKTRTRRATRAKTAEALAPTQDLQVDSNIKVDVQLTVDNLADMPAGEFEDLLDSVREEWQGRQAQLQKQHAELANQMKLETTKVGEGYKHPDATPLAIALAKFIGEPYDTLVEAKQADLQTEKVTLGVYVLPTVDKERYLAEMKKNNSPKESYSYRQGYSNHPELDVDVEVDFSDELRKLVSQINLVANDLKESATQLAKIESAYAQLPKLRERAKRMMTAATLQGKMQTNADILKFLNDVVPSSAKLTSVINTRPLAISGPDNG